MPLDSHSAVGLASVPLPPHSGHGRGYPLPHVVFNFAAPFTPRARLLVGAVRARGIVHVATVKRTAESQQLLDLLVDHLNLDRDLPHAVGQVNDGVLVVGQLAQHRQIPAPVVRRMVGPPADSAQVVTDIY